MGVSPGDGAWYGQCRYGADWHSVCSGQFQLDGSCMHCLMDPIACSAAWVLLIVKHGVPCECGLSSVHFSKSRGDGNQAEVWLEACSYRILSFVGSAPLRSLFRSLCLNCAH
jgi:hypothetical protein